MSLGIKPYSRGLMDIGNGAYAWMQPDGGWGWSNAGLITDGEREMILSENVASGDTNVRPPSRWRDLLKLPQTWGTIVAKALTDPVWFFVTDWFPIYLVAKGIPLKSGLLAVWIPFIASDLGNFFGGAASGYLIRRGWPLGAAPKK